MTVGGVIDWIISNAVAIGLIVTSISFIVKVSHKLDKLQREQSEIPKTLKDVKSTQETLSKSIEGATSRLTSLNQSLQALSGRLDACEAALTASTQDRSALHSVIDSLESEISSLEKLRENDTERVLITLQSIRASLVGLIEIGANGPVKEALSLLDSYLFERSSH